MASSVTPLACYRKKHYRTRDAAMAVVYRLRARGSDGIDAYQCAECRQWHLKATPPIGRGQTA